MGPSHYSFSIFSYMPSIPSEFVGDFSEFHGSVGCLSLACPLQPWRAPSFLESTQPLCAFGCPHSLVDPILILPLFYFSNEFSRMVAGEYLKFFVFTGMSLDQALRSVLSVCTCV